MEQTKRIDGEKCCNETWEAAYARFETRDEEIEKFLKRLVSLGAKQWPSRASILSLFCGRGSELHALSRLGFTDIEGVDLSPSLLAQYEGAARRRVADCRHLPHHSGEKDVIVVQGGLHHLPSLPQDLEQVLAEVHRVLKPDGLFVVIEPWQTPFLRFVHILSSNRLARTASQRLDAFEVMYQNERTTYDRWLSVPDMILSCIHERFIPIEETTSWGKLRLLARKRS